MLREERNSMSEDIGKMKEILLNVNRHIYGNKAADMCMTIAREAGNYKLFMGGMTGKDHNSSTTHSKPVGGHCSHPSKENSMGWDFNTPHEGDYNKPLLRIKNGAPTNSGKARVVTGKGGTKRPPFRPSSTNLN